MSTTNNNDIIFIKHYLCILSFTWNKALMFHVKHVNLFFLVTPASDQILSLSCSLEPVSLHLFLVRCYDPKLHSFQLFSLLWSLPKFQFPFLKILFLVLL